jgi:photosystem II stability/assembly factor-like uncharacterized protein
MRKFALLVAAAAVLTGTAVAASDPLDAPARPSSLAQQRLITSLARAGDHTVVAAGQRGHILRSTDGGKTWQQAPVPVSSDLTAVQFVDEHVGYCVGHDGVVMRSTDGGATWQKVLDGRAANKLLLDQMQAKVAAGGTDDDRKLLDEAKRNVAAGPDKPFLGLWFDNANEGFVVGAYNLIFRTSDGGKSWQSWFDRTDNPKLLNLYAIRRAGNALVVAGEGGLLLTLDAAAQRFRALDSAYKGSYFGVVGTSAGILAFGLRGNALLSRDLGKTWRPLVTGLVTTITAGDVGADGSLVLVDLAGNVVVSRDGGDSFIRIDVAHPAPWTAVTAVPGGAVLGGLRGVQVLDFTKDK